MDWFYELIRNPFLITAFSSWFLAQIIKVILNFAINKKISIERLFGDGGMPSGHSATVTSLATLAGLMYGFDSFQFAIACILAVIICHDAMGVRLETGKQAIAINEILRSFQLVRKLPQRFCNRGVQHGSRLDVSERFYEIGGLMQCLLVRNYFAYIGQRTALVCIEIM